MGAVTKGKKKKKKRELFAICEMKAVDGENAPAIDAQESPRQDIPRSCGKSMASRIECATLVQP